MNRRHTADDYRRIIDRLRTFKPGLACQVILLLGSLVRRTVTLLIQSSWLLI